MARVVLVRGEIIKHVAEIDVGHFPQRNDVRESDVAGGSPINNRGDQGAGLGYEGQIAGERRTMRKTRIEADIRNHKSDAVRP